MLATARRIIGTTWGLDIDDIVLASGGSAWSGAALSRLRWHVLCGWTRVDHVAVALYLEAQSAHLRLYHPCPFIRERQAFTDTNQSGWRSNPGCVLNQLHGKFSRATAAISPIAAAKPATRSLIDLTSALALGAEEIVRPGFHARNRSLVESCDRLIAFSFAPGPHPTHGGTAHAWGAARCVAVHVSVTATAGLIVHPAVNPPA